MAARFVDRVFENPATSGGLLVMALTASAIFSNAMFLQGSRHPGPLFAPRADVGRPASGPTPHKVASAPPVPVLAPAAAKVVDAPAPVEEPSGVSRALLAAVQLELARLGLYSNAVDGLNGPKTMAAISSYEVAAGLKPTGRATETLLAALKQQGVARDGTTAPPDTLGAEIESRTHARGEAIAAAQRSETALRQQENLRLVQNALNRIGYGPVGVSGKPDSQTRDAISRFELDNGLDITGEVSDAVIARLVAIGAIKAG